MARSTRNLDAGRLSQMVARPGIDPRLHVVLARVTAVGFDPQSGPLVDIEYVPDGTEDTALVGAPYAGNGFGAYFPLAVDDLVVVGIPNGDSNLGPVVIARCWTGGDRPFAAMQGANGSDGEPDPTTHVEIRTQAGKKFRVVVSGGGQVEVVAEGSDHVLVTAGGQVKLQDASQSFVRGENYADALGSFLTALNTFAAALGTFNTALGVGSPASPVLIGTVQGALTPFATALATFAAAISTFGNARTTYLSSKVKGQ